MTKEWVAYYRYPRWRAKRVSRWAPMGNFRFKLLTAEWVYVIRGKPYRGLAVIEYLARSHGAVRPAAAHVVRLGEPNVKKVKVKERSTVKHLAALESEYLKDVQGVVEALAMLQYEDGSPRQTAYLGVWVVGSTWTVRIQDKDADASLTAEGRTLDEALDQLQMYLSSDEAPWEPNSRKTKKKG